MIITIKKIWEALFLCFRNYYSYPILQTGAIVTQVGVFFVAANNHEVTSLVFWCQVSARVLQNWAAKIGCCCTARLAKWVEIISKEYQWRKLLATNMSEVNFLPKFKWLDEVFAESELRFDKIHLSTKK